MFIEPSFRFSLRIKTSNGNVPPHRSIGEYDHLHTKIPFSVEPCLFLPGYKYYTWTNSKAAQENGSFAMANFQRTVLLLLVCLFFWVSYFVTPFGYFLDSCAKEAVKNKQTRRGDLINQRDFFLMYYLAFFSCSLLRVSRQSIYRLREIPLAIFYVITNALVSHTFRYAIYVLIVHPWGKALPWENVCYPEGSKSISGHTHMYAFHGVFLWYTYTCTNDQLSQDPSATKQSRSFLDVIVQWFKISVFLSSSCLSMFSIWKTYAGGYHSVRDMVLGGLFGIFSVVLYVVCKAALVKKLWNRKDQKAT